LDESKIEQWWNNYKDDPNNLWTVANNCATVVVAALVEGNAKLSWYSLLAHLRLPKIWNPSTVCEFAKIIQENIQYFQ